MNFAKPCEQLPAVSQDFIRKVSVREVVAFTYLNERGKPSIRSHSFEGILHNLERRYHETDSAMVREELAKYLNSKPCPECGGTRLRIEARHVKVGDKNIHEICEAPLKQALTFFGGLKLSGQKLAIADKIVKEVISRLLSLTNVGLDYLSLSRLAE